MEPAAHRWRVVAGAALRAPVATRSWRAVAFLVASLPPAVAGCALMLVTTAVGILLSLTFIGLPLLAAGGLLSVWFGGLSRGLTRSLLGRSIAGAPPRPNRGGFFGWLQARLLEPRVWRARLYLLVKLPLAFGGLYAVVICYVDGVLALLYPVTRLTSGFDSWKPLLWGINLDTWPRSLVIALAGVAVLLAAPWVARGAAGLDALLMAKLLGPTAGDVRVERLERARSVVAADAATTLRRIERDLHDGTQAQLVALAMNLGELKQHMDPDSPAAELASAAHGHAKEALAELRNIARGIHPPSLDLGLDHALATLAARSAVPARLDARLDSRPDPAIESIAYYSAAELLTNVAKHSGAHRADVSVTERDTRLVLQVTDDGAGGADPAGGTGLLGLTNRLESVDGTLIIDSPAGGPTTVTVDLPIRL